MAAYADHGLSLAERARVERHLASCPQCTALLAGVVRTVAEVSAAAPEAEVTAEATPRIAWRAVAGALTAAAAVIAVLLLPSLARPWLERDAGLVSLVDSVGEQRSVLGRLTGGFPHAPLGVPPAGGQGGRAAGTDRVLPIAGRIRESFGDRETPSRLHALGVSQLLAGRYDDAAQSLLAASREQPGNAQYLSDVAAVHLERARLGLRPDDLPRALAAADRARRLDPSLREAWFNRALAATALSLTEHARTAWTEYLKRDSSSPWAAEARARLNELSKPTPAAAWASIEGRLQQPIDAATADEAVRTQTTEARNFIENVLFVEWANAVLGGGSGSAELERLRVMGDAMLRVAGDALYRDAVTAIDRAGTTHLRQSLAAAHNQYGQAAALVADDRYSAAQPGLIAARDAFIRADSGFAMRASLDLGAVAHFSGRWPDVAASHRELLQSATARNYTNLAARVTWQQGLAAMAAGRLTEAQAHYEETLATFERMGDSEQIAAANSLIAALSDYLGEADVAWRHRLLAFQGLRVSSSARFKYSVLASAVPSIRAENPESALLMQDEALTVATAWGNEAAIADSMAQRASLLSALGRNVEADQCILEARAQLEKVPDPIFKSRIEVAVLSTESELLRRRDPAAAVSAASRAIDIVQQRRDHMRLAQLQLRLAKANIVWGRHAEATAALNRGLQAFNEEHSARTEDRPISALDESWELFDASVQLALRNRDYSRAFALSERTRVRSASEARRTEDVDLSAVEGALEPGEAILSLDQFEDELAIWVIRPGRTEVVMRPLGRRDAARLVARQQTEIWQERATFSASLDLYNEVIRPVRSSLIGVSRLIVVPDVTFQDAAFAAFWNGSEHRFLVEEMTVRAAPSAGTYAVAAGREVMERRTAPLVLSGPESGGQTTRAVAEAYESSVVLSGGDATRERFFNYAAGRPVVHVAARTSSNRTYPMLSRVLLSDDLGVRHSGAILGREIVQRTLPGTRLVVLDEVEANRSNRGEGTLALARAFMAAGVPAVLGTLPGADEDATRDLMIGFHREMAKSVSAEQALSTVQRDALQKNGRRLGAWTALVLYGSDR